MRESHYTDGNNLNFLTINAIKGITKFKIGINFFVELHSLKTISCREKNMALGKKSLTSIIPSITQVYERNKRL